MRKKIVLSFFISASIITFLVGFELFYFVQIRNEMRFLEMTDSVRTKSLQLRRHEKNFLLYPDKSEEELSQIDGYLNQLRDLISEIRSRDTDKAAILENLVNEYDTDFQTVKYLLDDITTGLETMKLVYPAYGPAFPLIEVAVRDKPLEAVEFLESTLAVPADDPTVLNLTELDTRMLTLRDTGENIIESSKEFDNAARNNAETGLRRSELAILVTFPVFLLIGISTLLLISTGMVRKLKTLTLAVEKISSRYIPETEAAAVSLAHWDEADVLLDKFRKMDAQLDAWEGELEEKNLELMRSKKLAAIGTMASGVAHEINNPLNNIQISAQVLKRQAGDDTPAEVREIVDDIISQTMRLKVIVGNLLEFAREREMHIRPVQLRELIGHAFDLVSGSVNTQDVEFNIRSDADGVTVEADYDRLQQVFVNLFTNAVAAMGGAGKLDVRMAIEDNEITVQVSDTGPGIPEEEREKIFDPFFTRREKGTGLGLAIVMNTMIKHGGRIAVLDGDTTPGAVFKLYLPRGDG